MNIEVAMFIGGIIGIVGFLIGCKLEERKNKLSLNDLYMKGGKNL